MVCSRAATLTASPIALNPRSSSLPMLPTSAGPVLAPTRNRGQSGCPAAISCTASCIWSAARTGVFLWAPPPHRPGLVIVLPRGRVEQRQQRIADELHDRPAIVENAGH